jgi:hypothetical protein
MLEVYFSCSLKNGTKIILNKIKNILQHLHIRYYLMNTNTKKDYKKQETTQCLDIKLFSDQKALV